MGKKTTWNQLLLTLGNAPMLCWFDFFLNSLFKTLPSSPIVLVKSAMRDILTFVSNFNVWKTTLMVRGCQNLTPSLPFFFLSYWLTAKIDIKQQRQLFILPFYSKWFVKNEKGRGNWLTEIRKANRNRQPVEQAEGLIWKHS